MKIGGKQEAKGGPKYQYIEIRPVIAFIDVVTVENVLLFILF